MFSMPQQPNIFREQREAILLLVCSLACTYTYILININYIPYWFVLESVSPVARIPRKAVGPMYIRRVIPEHVKDPRAPVEKSRVLIPDVTGQIPELLRIAVKLHRHHYR